MRPIWDHIKMCTVVFHWAYTHSLTLTPALAHYFYIPCCRFLALFQSLHTHQPKCFALSHYHFHRIASHHTQFGFPFELASSRAKNTLYYVQQYTASAPPAPAAEAVTAMAVTAAATTTAMDNHDALYVFILHVDSTLQRENAICIFSRNKS